MKFETYDKYLSLQDSRAQRFAEIAEKRTAAEAELRELKTEYEMTMQVSITQGTDVTKALDKLDDKIAKAKREVDRAAREYEIYGRVASVSISVDDVISSWNREFAPQYFEKEVKPALDVLEKAKQDYYDAMCTYWDKMRGLSRYREEVSGQMGFEYPYKFHIKELNSTAEFERYFITPQEMENAKDGRK